MFSYLSEAGPIDMDELLNRILEDKGGITAYKSDGTLHDMGDFRAYRKFWSILAISENIELAEPMMKKTAYVTGGLGLIGESVCMKFQSEGYDCIALDVFDTEHGTSKFRGMSSEFFDVSDGGILKEKNKFVFPRCWYKT